MAVYVAPYQSQGAWSSANLLIVPLGEAVPGHVLRFYSYGHYDVLGNATVKSASLRSPPLKILVVNLPEEIRNVIDSEYWTNKMRAGSSFTVVDGSIRFSRPRIWTLTTPGHIRYEPSHHLQLSS